MKNRVVNAACCLPEWGDGSVEVKNLRRGKGGLVPAGVPAVECVNPGGKMIGMAWGKPLFLDGRRVLWMNGGVPEVAGVLPGDYRCHAAVDGSVIFMTGAGAWCLKRSSTGAWIVDDFTQEYPKIRIGIHRVREFAASTPPRELSGDYRHWMGPLDASDSRRLTADVIDAYSGVVSQAGDAGYYAQPVAVWYRLLGSRGELLYRSDPVVVSDGGYHGLDAWWGDVGISGGVYRNLGSVQVKLRGFALGYEVEALSGGHTLAASVAEVYVSPLIDPVDYAGTATATFGSHDATSARLGLRLPQLAGHEERVRRLLDRLDAVGTRVAVIQNPFSSAGSGMTLVDSCRIVDPAKESAALTAALKRNADVERGIRAEISQPHRFSAGAVGVCSDMIAWGDIVPLSALPAGVWVNIAETSVAQGWSAVTRVTVDRGGVEEILSVSESGDSGAPASLGPVVGYRDPQAKRLQVTVTRSDGIRLGVDLPLTPTADGSCACYVSPGLVPVELTEGVQAISPVTMRGDVAYCGGIAVARLDNPLIPVAVGEVSTGRVAAIAESPRYGNSLDMGRRHIAVFTTGGIHVAGVNPSRGVIASHRIDDRGVEHSGAVAVSNTGIYAASAGRLLLVDGSRVKVVARGCGFTALGYSGRYGEVACLDASGRLWMVDESGCVAQRELPQRATDMCRQGSRVWIIGESDVYDLDREEEGAVAVRYSRVMRRQGVRGVWSLSRAVWMMGATNYSGALSVKGSNNCIDEVTVASFRVNGRINLPPHTPILGCRYRCVRVTVDGVMSTDGVINEIILE